MYQKVALQPHEQYHFEMGRALAERLGYPSEKLDQVPASAIDSFAGVGYYFALANLQQGQTVVDLGSGAGMDAFFAANEVGSYGKVIGIDMTIEQLEKANSLKNKFGFNQVSFVESYIERLPLENESADAVISNGVVNLSSNKAAVFEEASRILRPGGKLILSDIVSSVVLPESISCNATLWAACIGGAMEENAYIALIESSGLEVIQTEVNPYEFISKSALGATRSYGIKSISVLARKK